MSSKSQSMPGGPGIAAKCAGVLAAAYLEGFLSPSNAPGNTTGFARGEGTKKTSHHRFCCGRGNERTTNGDASRDENRTVL
jgi:hypothetical protein